MATDIVKYLTIPQAAEVIGCSPLTIRRMISRGEIAAVRFGRLIRIPPAALDRAERLGRQVDTTTRATGAVASRTAPAPKRALS